jgi:hypothetical protein
VANPPANPTPPPNPPAPVDAATAARAEEIQRRRLALLERVVRVRLLAELPGEEHRVVSPVSLVIGNKGMLAEPLARLVEKHRRLLQERQSLEMSGSAPMSSLRKLNLALSMALSGSPLLEAAFYIGLEELRERAAQLGGNALCTVQHQVTFDAPTYQSFTLHLSAIALKIPSLDAADAEAEAARAALQAMESVEKSMANVTPLNAGAQAALEDLRRQLDKQQEALKTAREELREREKFLEESEARLFEKFQDQQVRETELDMREERIARIERTQIKPGS